MNVGFILHVGGFVQYDLNVMLIICVCRIKYDMWVNILYRLVWIMMIMLTYRDLYYI